jgi:predicted dienelactone hydrolase
MAGTVFALALVLEVGFAAYCIVTRSSQRRVRNFVRLGAFAAFIVLVVLSVLKWSFRWYGLALLLLVWAVVGAVQLLRRKTDTATFKPGRLIGRLVGTLALVWLALVPAFILPQHKPPRVTGVHPVATTLYTYTDPNRIEAFAPASGHRQVNVECWYPADGHDKYPLVVFSHGALGIKASNTSTFTELASNGYVVCSIDHPYHALFTRGADGHLVIADPTFRQQIVGINAGSYTETEIFQMWQDWLGLRTADINFVLDTILAEAASPGSDPVYQMIDTGRIGLMGHSLGGASVGLVARQRADVGAVVVLDADLQGEYLHYSDGKYTLNDQVYPVPLLAIMADDMVNLIAKVPDAAHTVAIEHVLATAPHAYKVHIQGTDHQSVTDLELVSPFLASMVVSMVPKAGGGQTADRLYVVETMNDLVLKFFNAYLKGEGAFQPEARY